MQRLVYVGAVVYFAAWVVFRFSGAKVPIRSHWRPIAKALAACTAASCDGWSGESGSDANEKKAKVRACV